MKHLFLLLFFLLSSSLFAFSKHSSKEPILVQKGDSKHWCSICGMRLKYFYKTSHVAEYNDGTKKQYCSMRCLVVDMKKHQLQNIQVIDTSSEKLIDAKDAFYVVGSDIRGTMSKVSKFAFKDSDIADDFSMENGGDVVSFTQALELAKSNLMIDLAMVEKKKKKKVYPMGERIFKKVCDKNINLGKYRQVNELKADIKNNKLCKPLKEKQLQILSIYLFEVKKAQLDTKQDKIKVTEDEKCPICGMFVYKFSKWAAQIYYEDKHYSFDGVKDMMKYYFEHKQKISKMLVTDYYSIRAIDAKKAYFVIGSEVYGPMGEELLPFKSKDDAITFSLDHKGFKVLKFNEIEQKDLE